MSQNDNDLDVQREIERLGEFHDKWTIVIAGPDAAVALHYSPPTLKIPIMVAWSRGYPFYDAVLILAKRRDIPIHEDDMLADELVDFYMNDANRNHPVPRETFTRVAKALISTGVVT